MEARPSPEYSYDAAITKLVSVLATTKSASTYRFVTPGDEDIPDHCADGNEVGFGGSRGGYLKLSAYVDTESRITIGCTGAALIYIGRRKTAALLPASIDGSPAFRVSSVEMFSLDDLMYVKSHRVR